MIGAAHLEEGAGGVVHEECLGDFIQVVYCIDFAIDVGCCGHYEDLFADEGSGCSVFDWIEDRPR